jgi:hypothetical protein
MRTLRRSVGEIWLETPDEYLQSAVHPGLPGRGRMSAIMVARYPRVTEMTPSLNSMNSCVAASTTATDGS